MSDHHLSVTQPMVTTLHILCAQAVHPSSFTHTWQPLCPHLCHFQNVIQLGYTMPSTVSSCTYQQYVSFLCIFPQPGRSSLFHTNILSYKCTSLPIASLKKSLITFMFWGFWNKAAVDIHVPVLCVQKFQHLRINEKHTVYGLYGRGMLNFDKKLSKCLSTQLYYFVFPSAANQSSCCPISFQHLSAFHIVVPYRGVCYCFIN